MPSTDATSAPPPRKKTSKATGAKKTTTRRSTAPSRGPGAKKKVDGRRRKRPLSELKGSRRADGSYVHPSRARPKKDRIEDKRTAMARRASEKEELATDKELTQGQTVLLAEMATFINDYFDKKAPLKEFTPYDWWRRHKVGRLSTPLPKPIRMVGMGPLFRASDIVKWYRVYVENKGRWESGV